jgi:WD40 repeat protein
MGIMKKLFLVFLFAAVISSVSSAFEGVAPSEIYTAEGAINSISISTQGVAVGSDDNNLYLFDLYLKKQWTYAGRDSVKAVASSDRFVVFGSADNTLTLLDYSGKAVWERGVETYVEYPHAIDIVEDTIAAGTRDGVLYVYDTRGNLLWKQGTDSYIITVKILKSSILVVSDKRIHIFRFDGTEQKLVSLNSYVRSAQISDDYVVVGLGDNELALYNVDGTQRWSMKLADPIGSGSVYASRDYVVVGLHNNSVYLINESGKSQWQSELSASVIGVMTDGEQVLAATLDDKLYLMNLDGERLWEYKTSGRVRDMQENPAGVFIGTSLGEIYYFKPLGYIPLTFFVMIVSVVVLIGALAIFLRTIK